MHEINFIPNGIKARDEKSYTPLKLTIYLIVIITSLVVCFYIPQKCLSNAVNLESRLFSKNSVNKSSGDNYKDNQKKYFETIEVIKKQRHVIGNTINSLIKQLLPSLIIQNIKFNYTGMSLKGITKNYYELVKFEEKLVKSQEPKNVRIISLEYNLNNKSYIYTINITP